MSVGNAVVPVLIAYFTFAPVVNGEVVGVMVFPTSYSMLVTS
jgi:hypothetical protein